VAERRFRVDYSRWSPQIAAGQPPRRERPRERPLSPRPDTQVERGERPVIELHRSLDQTIATDRKWSKQSHDHLAADQVRSAGSHEWGAPTADEALRETCVE